MKITERAGERARSTGRRAERVLRGEQHGPGWLGATVIAALTGAAGAIAAFLLDPARGRGRRARLIEQGGATVRRTIRQSERTLRTIRANASGSMAAATHPGDGDTEQLDDATLAAKLETRLFRDPSVPKGSINVNVERGIAILRGEVPDDAMRERLASEAAAVGGVWSVHNLLHLPGQPIEEKPAPARS
jgi:hypothetical protein